MSVQAFMNYFGLRKGEADILQALHRAAVPITAPNVNVLKVRICNIRNAMESESVDTVPEGYVLTEIGRAECAKAIAMCGGRRRA